MLNESREPVVLMTHHAPSRQSIPARYQNDPLSAAYASDSDCLFENTRQQPAVAVHDHTHQSQDHTRPCGARVFVNPYGCHGIEKNLIFNPGSLVSLDEQGKVNVLTADKISPD